MLHLLYSIDTEQPVPQRLFCSRRLIPVYTILPFKKEEAT